MDDLIVVGAGWAGISATVFALEKGLKVRLIAQGIGSPVVTPAWISVWDSAKGNILEGIPTLSEDHPYRLAGIDALSGAMESFKRWSEKIGLPYIGTGQTNHSIPTMLGTQQNPALVPSGYSANPGHTKLFIGFKGWRDYYPALSGEWTETIDLPMVERPWDATPADLARQFDLPYFRKGVADRIKPRIKGVTSVGFPAVLGFDDPVGAKNDLEKLLGLPVFEMPTLPPSVPGTRLFNRARRYFLDNRVRVQIGHPVTRGVIENGRVTGVEVAAAGKPQFFPAKNILLATGGLYGGGLFSDDRGNIWEGVFNLPVEYDPDRGSWFNADLLDPKGHPVHYFGVRANAKMQPLNEAAVPFAEGLYVAGRILAHPRKENSPLPTECAEGVSLATAYKAVSVISEKR